MQFSTATIAAVAAFLPSLVSAHIKMISPPTVFKEVATDLNPLDPSGDNYPCFVTTGSTGELPVYQLGSQQQIELAGTAVHGGGSCQVSITYDNPPNKNSVFKVLASYEGGCPGGQDSDTNRAPGSSPDLPPLPYTIPSDIPSGEAVVAWSWFNKIGNREMYMRCAPIKIDGSNTDTSGFNALPDMFKANIGNGCSTTEGTNVVFPNPGSNLSGKGTGAPVGDCGSAVSPPPVLIVVPTPPPVDTPTPAPTSVTVPDVLVETPQSEDTATPVPTPEPTPEPTPAPENPEQPSTNGTCVDGAIVCTGLNTWSMCVYGEPKPMGQTADGINCLDGKMVLARRSVRFSHEHVRRRHRSLL